MSLFSMLFGRSEAQRARDQARADELYRQSWAVFYMENKESLDRVAGWLDAQNGNRGMNLIQSIYDSGYNGGWRGLTKFIEHA